MCVGVGGLLVWILSSSGLFNQRDLENSSINTFLSPEKLMAAERSDVVKRVKSTTITVSVCGWLNYNLWFTSSSWCCQRGRGEEVTLWQHRFGEGLCPYKYETSLHAAAFPKKSNKMKCSVVHCMALKCHHDQKSNIKEIMKIKNKNIKFSFLMNLREWFLFWLLSTWYKFLCF